MPRFILRRLAQGVVVIFLLTSVVFVVTRLIGDPVNVMLPLEATRNSVRSLVTPLG